LPRFTFKKTERLSSLKAIEDLYKEGASFYNTDLKCIYLVKSEAQPAPCQVVFSVPKRNFKRAVDRNLLKRRMREAYRLHKHLLYEHLAQKQKNLHLLVIYTNRETRTFEEVENSLLKALKTLIGKAIN